MEACCLISNSFTETTKLVSSTKAKVTSYPKRSRNFNHFHRQKVAFSSSIITCCHMESSDWRSFRARLVATEQTTRPQVHEPPQNIIGDKWAHTIHEPEKGCLLIATEKLDGVHILERTVILLLSTEPMGPSGIILNRPSLMSIKEVRSTAAGTFSDQPLFFGGPLEEGLFLLSPKGDDDGVGVFEEVMKGLYFGTKENVGCVAEMVKRNVVGPEDFRFFDGCCGWEKEQLNEEIRAGYWTLAACSPNVIGLDNGTLGLWDDVLWLMGPKKVW